MTRFGIVLIIAAIFGFCDYSKAAPAEDPIDVLLEKVTKDVERAQNQIKVNIFYFIEKLNLFL